MDEIKFSSEALNALKNNLQMIKIKSTGNDQAEKTVNKLLEMVAAYEKENISVQPDIYNNLIAIIDSLKDVQKDAAVQISRLAKDNCRACMFHADTCFMNLVFIIFKSLEIGKYIEINGNRPNLRLSF